MSLTACAPSFLSEEVNGSAWIASPPRSPQLVGDTSLNKLSLMAETRPSPAPVPLAALGRFRCQSTNLKISDIPCVATSCLISSSDGTFSKRLTADNTLGNTLMSPAVVKKTSG